jgi:hypothetical protein
MACFEVMLEWKGGSSINLFGKFRSRKSDSRKALADSEVKPWDLHAIDPYGIGEATANAFDRNYASSRLGGLFHRTTDSSSGARGHAVGNCCFVWHEDEGSVESE